jgi:hypothetical protein
MEALRKNDELERAGDEGYGWRDILMETLRLSREEYRLLTDRTLTLQALYGFPAGKSEKEVRAELSNARDFAHRLGLSYEELVEILKTRFVNPSSTLIPRLERLGVPFARLKALKESSQTGQAWLDLLAQPLPEAAQYGGDIEKWVKDEVNFANIMSLITLASPSGSGEECSFETLEFRYANPDKIAQPVEAIEFVRLMRFIRLWKKLGWTIEYTDKAITALYPADQIPDDPDDAINLQRLDAGFLTLLPRLGILRRVTKALKLKPQNDLLPLLALFAPIDAHGEYSPYRSMFLSPALVEQDPVFADDGFGNFLQKISVAYTHPQTTLEQPILEAAANKIAYDPVHGQLTFSGDFAVKTRDALKEVAGVTEAFQAAVEALYDKGRLAAHAETLRAAFAITDEELAQITAALGFDADTPLTLENVSAVFRRGWLARALKLSVREFLLLTEFTGLDPFAAPDPPDPPVLRLIELLDHLRQAALKPAQALYLIWNQDVSGKSTPEETEILDFARTLRAFLAAIESEFALAADPDGQIARARMALVYGSEATDLFFGLLNRTFVTDVAYDHTQPLLEPPILDAAPGRIAYDDFRKRLSFSGVMADATRDALKSAAGVDQAFKQAVDDLYAKTRSFFAPYPELLPLHGAFIFFGDLRITIPYTHHEDQLSRAILEPAQGRITYDKAAGQLAFTGVLSEVLRDALQNLADETPEFRTAVGQLFENNQTAIKAFFERYPELAGKRDDYLAANDGVEQRRTLLLASILPELKSRRKRQQAAQAMGATAGTEVEFARAVLDARPEFTAPLFDPRPKPVYVLHAAGDPGRPALDDLAAAERPGLSARFFFRNTATGPADLDREAEANLAYALGSNPLPKDASAPGSPVSGVWSGYLEAPEDDFYKILIETDLDATVTLTMGGARVALEQHESPHSNKEPLELHAGTLYRFVLRVENVKDKLAVRWETRGRGREIIPARFLYPTTSVDALRQVYVRFLKAASLAKALKLEADELAYLAAHPHYRIGGQGWLNHVRVVGNPSRQVATKLLKALDALLDFARFKAALGSEDGLLLLALQDPAAAAKKPEGPLFSLTRWEPTSLKALLHRFGKKADDLADLAVFRRVYEAMGWVKQMGVPAAALIAAATNTPNASIVRDLQSALRARFEESDWLKVLKSINDELRALQRDALVAHILQGMHLDPATAHIDTPEKLFEFFLMDVQMEPCMETSRIRHALSSVQLFIERSLMNLEPGVLPAVFPQKQWEWMSRYRVWEANRKVFLFPENWLEPELRDDQSPFFKATMSELLQSDITQDSAEVALLNYLAKLDEVAKLEPCGIYYEEDDTETEVRDDVVHVVARTAGANRKYYYRRFEDGSWTPWEHIPLDIEDDPAVPVVWNDRLLLFWLRILQQGSLAAPNLPEGPLDQADPSKLLDRNASRVTVQAVLSWSEYYNGKWQPTRTSSLNKPLALGSYDPVELGTLRESLSLSSSEKENALQIHIVGARGSVFKLPPPLPTFTLYNTHSLPVLTSEMAPIDGQIRVMETEDDEFRITYLPITRGSAPRIPLVRHILKNLIDDDSDHTIEPRHELANAWDAPFIFADGRHVFFVTTAERPVSFLDWSGFVPLDQLETGTLALPRLIQRELPVPQRPVPVGQADSSPVGSGIGAAGRADLQRFVTEDALIHWGIATLRPVRMGKIDIGPVGGLLNGDN